MVRRAKTLECSSAGDQRFSAFYARIELMHNGKLRTKSIEEWYQLSKRFGKIKPLGIDEAKGKKPTHLVIDGKRYPSHFLTQWYKLLWLKYLDENPDLVKFASRFDKFTDQFKGRRSKNCQADVIRQYVKDGRQSIIDECEYLLDESNRWREFRIKRPRTTLPIVMAWSDGACKGNGTPNARGGWAYIVQHNNEERTRFGSTLRTTNNQMELRAVIEIFRRLKQPCHVTIHTDSEYVERAFSEGRLQRSIDNGWLTTKKQPVANVDMWKELLAAMKDGRHVVRFKYRDEEKDPNILRCHKMATAAAERQSKPRR